MYTHATPQQMSWPVARKITITLEVSDEATPIQVAAMKALVLTADEGKGVTALGKLINKSRTRAHAYLNGSTVPGPVAVEISRALDGSPTVEELITGKFADQEDETE